MLCVKNTMKKYDSFIDTNHTKFKNIITKSELAKDTKNKDVIPDYWTDKSILDRNVNNPQVQPQVKNPQVQPSGTTSGKKTSGTTSGKQPLGKQPSGTTKRTSIDQPI